MNNVYSLPTSSSTARENRAVFAAIVTSLVLGDAVSTPVPGTENAAAPAARHSSSRDCELMRMLDKIFYWVVVWCGVLSCISRDL